MSRYIRRKRRIPPPGAHSTSWLAANLKRILATTGTHTICNQGRPIATVKVTTIRGDQ